MAKFERMFFTVGFALLTLSGAAMVHGIVFSPVALAQSDANQGTEAGSSVSATLHNIVLQHIVLQHDVVQHDAASGSDVDFALWSVKRAKEYKESLLEKFDTPLGVLRIPKVHLNVPIFDGTDDLILNRGAGRIAGTAQVGAPGNLGIAGHRDGFFRGLKDVAKGDVIELTHDGQTDFYRIDGIQIVKPDNVSVLESTPEPSLTLVTCFPFYFFGSAPERYIVKASLVNFSPGDNVQVSTRSLP